MFGLELVTGWFMGFLKFRHPFLEDDLALKMYCCEEKVEKDWRFKFSCNVYQLAEERHFNNS